MLKYFEDLKTVCSQLKNRSISMQQKLMLYFLSIIAVILCILLVVFAVTGLLSFSQQHVHQGLSMALDNSVSKITQQLDHFTAQGIKLSGKISTEIDYLMQKNNMSFQELNNHPERIEELQQALYNPLSGSLEALGCSGAYIILDATVNTEAPGADDSRSGLYLRRTSMNDCNPVNSGTALFRGGKEVARKNKLELHNRWNMEFDVKKFPFYWKFKGNPALCYEGSYLWTKKQALPETWEKVMYLVVPIVGSQGEFYGVCGLEISELYFQLAYPSFDSEFGTMVTVLAPLEQGTLYLSEGLCGAEKRGKFPENSLRIKPERRFQHYSSGDKEYIGASEDISMSVLPNDTRWTVTVLLSASNFRVYVAKRKIILVLTFVLLLLCLIMMSVFLSRRYVRPITQGLEAIQHGNLSHDASSGLSELDELMQFLRTQQEHTTVETGDLPEGIREIFDNFIERCKSLTNAERNILEYYINGYQIMEIPDLAYISMSTVRKHNRSIYEKLEVSSKDELMLYIDLLRRCGKLDDIPFGVKE